MTLIFLLFTKQEISGSSFAGVTPGDCFSSFCLNYLTGKASTIASILLIGLAAGFQ